MLRSILRTQWKELKRNYSKTVVKVKRQISIKVKAARYTLAIQIFCLYKPGSVGS
jgi:hypothetical protein